MDIKEIADTINEKAKNYQMSTFQDLRVKLHSKKQRPTTNIFFRDSIKNKDNNQYAFHYGGRKELQFNIGFIERDGKDKFRYGIALSLEQSQSLPDYTILDKKFIRFSDFIKTNKSNLSDFEMYYHDDERNKRTYIPVNELDPRLFRNHIFIFLGKIIPPDEIDYNKILTTFDQFLDAYKYVEGDEELREIDTTHDKIFKFEPKFSDKIDHALRKPSANKTEVDLRHNQIQGKIYHILVEKHGKENVGTEINTGFATNIDLVVKHDSTFLFYEIKTNSSLRLCIREALGQLIEYGYWNNEKPPEKLVIISENPITNDVIKYLQRLRNELKLNVYYQQFDFDNNTLSDPY